jgi:transcription initiation factor TFIID subunit TAF12
LKIPSKNQYPDEMKRMLWGSVKEITENARRNTIEYSADGWDWKTATEEHDMYLDKRTGEYIHPVHIQRLQKQLQEKQQQKQQQRSIGEDEQQQQEVTSSITSSPKQMVTVV